MNKKLIGIALLAIVVLVSVLTMASCSGSKELIVSDEVLARLFVDNETDIGNDYVIDIWFADDPNYVNFDIYKDYVRVRGYSIPRETLKDMYFG